MLHRHLWEPDDGIKYLYEGNYQCNQFSRNGHNIAVNDTTISAGNAFPAIAKRHNFHNT